MLSKISVNVFKSSAAHPTAASQKQWQLETVRLASVLNWETQKVEAELN